MGVSLIDIFAVLNSIKKFHFVPIFADLGAFPRVCVLTLVSFNIAVAFTGEKKRCMQITSSNCESGGIVSHLLGVFGFQKENSNHNRSVAFPFTGLRI